MRNAIHIKGIKLYGYHGCLPEEGKIGTNYIIDIEIETDFMAAANQDDLSKTVDYCDVYNVVKREMSIRSKLIEHVGKRIHEAIRDEIKGINKLKVEIKKLRPPMNGDVDEVSIVIND